MLSSHANVLTAALPLVDETNENVGLTAITETTTEVLFPRGCLFVLLRDESLRCSFVL